MCFPIAALGLSAAGTAAMGSSVLGAGASIAQGMAAQQSAKYNEALAAREEKLAGQKASIEQQNITRETRQLAGTQRAVAAGQGRGFSGSALDVVQQSNVTSEMDILSAIYGGQVAQGRAVGNKRLARAQGKGAMKGAIFSAGSTLLTGGMRARELS